jgi:hypothetical protein
MNPNHESQSSAATGACRTDADITGVSKRYSTRKTDGKFA